MLDESGGNIIITHRVELVCSQVTDTTSSISNNSGVTSESLARVVGDFLQGSRDAVILENGGGAFDLTQSKYSISGERGKCLLSKLEICRERDRRTPSARKAARSAYQQNYDECSNSNSQGSRWCS